MAAQVICVHGCLSPLEPVMPPCTFSSSFCCHYRTQYSKKEWKADETQKQGSGQSTQRPISSRSRKGETEAEICVDLISVELWPLFSREQCCGVDGAAGQKEFNAGHALWTQNPPPRLLHRKPWLQVMLADAAPISPEWSQMKTHTLSPLSSQLLVWLALISQTNVSHVTLIPPTPTHSIPSSISIFTSRRHTAPYWRTRETKTPHLSVEWG